MLKTIELASSPAYQVAAALELAVAQRAAVWRDHPDYRDWADEDQATPGAAPAVPDGTPPGPACSRARPRGAEALQFPGPLARVPASKSTWAGRISSMWSGRQVPSDMSLSTS